MRIIYLEDDNSDGKLFCLLLHHLLIQHTKPLIRNYFLRILLLNVTEKQKEKIFIVFFSHENSIPG